MSILIPNWKEVLGRSAVVWVGVIGGILPEVPGWILKWIDAGQADFLAPEAKNYLRMFLMMFAIPLARVWQQRRLATATERRLLAEKNAREKLEDIATSEGPPITKEQAKVIRKDAAIAASAEPVRDGVLRE